MKMKLMVIFKVVIRVHLLLKYTIVQYNFQNSVFCVNYISLIFSHKSSEIKITSYCHYLIITLE